MPRPGIVRADTLDLQDQNAPSAQNHSSSSAHKNYNEYTHFDDNELIGQHHRAEVRHAYKERQDEQRQIQNGSYNHREHYGDDDDDDMEIHRHHVGEESPPDENGDIVTDDDLMGGRISSSPSIDDGTLSPLPLRLIDPARTASLNLATTATSPENLETLAVHASSSSASVTCFSTDACRSGAPTPNTTVTSINMSGTISAPHHPRTHNPPSNKLEITSVMASSESEYTAVDSGTTSPEFTMQPYTGYRSGRHIWNTSAPSFQGDDDVCSSAFLECPGSFHLQFDPDRTSSPSESDDSWSTLSELAEYDFSKLDRDFDCYADGGVDNDVDLDARNPSRIDARLLNPDHYHDECLLQTEDIDFDFVYALHTFIATVEGQANATKGDTMVLLDDSNSYWWLVRLVKDSSIGYLPAEHIETPTERLARLNKHRNGTLSSSMLTDNQDKPKKSSKKGMRRRNVKTVQFAPPSYVEPSDYDYTSDEDEMSPEVSLARPAQQLQQDTEAQRQDQQAGRSRLKTGGLSITAAAPVTSPEEITSAVSASPSSPVRDAHSGAEEPLSPKVVERNEGAPLKTSRKGTPRNADSFLRDETAEPQKMSLTPGWLSSRDELSTSATSPDADNNSIDSFERPGNDKSGKGEKKRKEKKTGVLGGLFKRKDKKEDKSKRKDDQDVNTEENRASPRPSKEAEGIEKKDSLKKGKAEKPSRLGDKSALANQTRSANHVAELEGSQVAHEAPTGREDEIQEMASRTKARLAKARKNKEAQPGANDLGVQKSDGREDQARASPSPLEPSPTFMHGTEVVHIPDTPTRDQFDAREDLEDEIREVRQNDVDPDRTPVSTINESFATSDEVDDGPPSALEPSPIEPAYQDMGRTTPVASREVTPQPPSLVSPIQSSSETNASPRVGLGDDTISLVERQGSKSSATTVSTAASRNVNSPVTELVWSDSKLHAWLDGDNNDVRDMLVLVHDTSDVQPVGPDHPLMSSLFVEETTSLQKISDELDSMLADFLRRNTNSMTETNNAVNDSAGHVYAG